MKLTKYLVFNFYSPKIWIVFLLIWGLIIGTPSSTLTSQLEREANAILNSRWWNTYDANYNISYRCNWDEIFCNKVGSISEINIDYHFEVPPSARELATLDLSTFQNLESLTIRSISMGGTIPKEIGLLSKLTHLDLSDNYLVGEIPPSLGGLRQLKYLDISNNILRGSIPLELGFLKNLTALDLSYNRFKGEIPSSLGNLEKLVYLNISGNYIQGSIPLELGFLKNLTTLDLSYNRLI
ncbi:receptor protein kinase-like protein, partial [Trifolium pratense]